MLTSKVTAFVEHYTGDCEGNGAKAAELAGYSKAGAKVRACELLKRVDVQAAISNRLALIRNQPVTPPVTVEEPLTPEQQAAIADAVERRVTLTGIMRRNAIDDPDVANRAIDTLNRMDSIYIQKHLHAGVVRVVASEADERL